MSTISYPRADVEGWAALALAFGVGAGVERAGAGAKGKLVTRPRQSDCMHRIPARDCDCNCDSELMHLSRLRRRWAGGIADEEGGKYVAHLPILARRLGCA